MGELIQYRPGFRESRRKKRGKLQYTCIYRIINIYLKSVCQLVTTIVIQRFSLDPIAISVFVLFLGGFGKGSLGQDKKKERRNWNWN